MSEIIDIKIGQSLPPERWFEAADNLQEVFPVVARRLEQLNHDGMGKQDAQDFMADAMLALVAMRFVGANASENCRFIPVPDGGKGGGGR